MNILKMVCAVVLMGAIACSAETPPAAAEAVDTMSAVDAGPAVDGAAGQGDATEDAGPAVTRLNQESEKRGIELVFVLGDIGWSGDLKPARAALDKLTVPSHRRGGRRPESALHLVCGRLGRRRPHLPMRIRFTPVFPASSTA